MRTLKFGDVVYGELPDMGGSIQKGDRYLIVVSNPINNMNSDVIIVVPVTTSKTKSKIPVHCSAEAINGRSYGMCLCEQPRPIVKNKVVFKNKLTMESIHNVKKCLRVQLEL